MSLKEFKKDLKELLMKHNASIGVTIEGDTHGLGTQFIVELKDKEYVLKPYSNYLNKSDI